MRTLPLLSLIVLLALVSINAFFAYHLFLKDKLAVNKTFSPQSYLDRGLQVIFEAKGKVTNLPPPVVITTTTPPAPMVATTSESSFITKATSTPKKIVTPPPVNANLKQALIDLRVAATQMYATVSTYDGLCANGLINDSGSDELARIVGAILSSRNLSSQIEAGVRCQTTLDDYQVAAALSDGSAWCVSRSNPGSVCAL